MSDISFLPEDMRGKENTPEAKVPVPEESGVLKMHVPKGDADEDIEIIEVDEGDLSAVLADEPFMTRLTYRVSSAIDQLREKLFAKKEGAPPPKVPPQFFRPPRPGLVSAPPSVPRPPGSASATIRSAQSAPPGSFARGSSSAPGAPVRIPGTGLQPSGATKPRITPQVGAAPRRVRVIRRVRKPVRVSLISAHELAVLTVDVSKRKWTLAVLIVGFAVIFTGSYLFMHQQTSSAESHRNSIQQELGTTRKEISDRLKDWNAYSDLQDRIDLLDGALKRHIVITRLFDFLETRTIPSVSYRGASWSDRGSLMLDVVTDSYESAARQLTAFKESGAVKKAEALSFAFSPATEGEPAQVMFQVILDLDLSQLRNPALEPAASSTRAAS